ncbi:uncharacterized protein [Rutidosis leptorrhynchoides]|uniref:uncharacterized protein n=1 Tax=Rutidosis leptorrhynchoides TaxID=125765 RepID=UPI003A9A0AD7
MDAVGFGWIKEESSKANFQMWENGESSKCTSATQISKLDFSDPLYLHTNDTTGTPITAVKLKGTKNYNIWSRSMLLALSTKNKIGFINGTIVRSQTDEILASQLDRCNSVVLSWILGSVIEDLYSGQIFSTNASDVWKELKETYDKIDTSIIYNLHHQINTLKQAVTSHKDHVKMMQLMQFLMGLNDDTTHKDESSSSASSSAHAVLTNDQLMKLLSLINENATPVDANANMAGMSDIVDISKLKLTVGHLNGTQAKVVKIGNLKISNNVILYDVLVIPEYCDLKAMTTVGTGSQSGGLYLFDDHDLNVVGLSCNVCVHLVSAQLWHARLGHPSVQVLKVLKQKLNLKDIQENCPCDICHKAKQVREPFPLSDHKSQELGDLIHLDLWGPFKIQSRDGYKYFLTIVDDFSRGVVITRKISDLI